MSSDRTFRERPSAQDLADVLRAQHEARVGKGRRDPAIPAQLRQLGDLDGIPPVAKPGAGAPLIKMARGVLRVFLRPWLAVQTLFNQELLKRMLAIDRDLADLERRTPRIQDGLHQVERRLQAVEAASPACGTAGEPIVPEWRAIERAFVHSRVPRPPARILTIGAVAAALTAELGTFGFEVCALGSEMSWPAASVDVIIDLRADEPAARPDGLIEAAKWLKPGGHLLASRGDAAGSGLLDAVLLDAATVAGWVPAEVLTARNVAGAWQVTAGRETGPAVLLLHVRRADAPAR